MPLGLYQLKPLERPIDCFFLTSNYVCSVTGIYRDVMWDRQGGNDIGGREASAHIGTEKSLRRTRSDDKDDKDDKGDKVKNFPRGTRKRC